MAIAWRTRLSRLLPASLQGRLLATYLALALLGLGGLILWTGQRLQAAALARAEQELALQAQIIASALAEPLEHVEERRGAGGAALAVAVRGYAQATGHRVTVADSRPEVLASSDERVPPRAAVASPELLSAREGGVSGDIRRDEWTGEERLFVAVPVLEEGRELRGFVQLSRPMAPIYGEVAATWLSLLLAGLVVLLSVALVSLFVAREIARPIGRLTRVSEALAAGQLEQHVEPAGPDEIRRLGQAFNEMAERVREMLARQRDFVAHAAHELRSPLAALRLRLELLRADDGDGGVPRQEYLTRMERDVDHLARLVDHLLALSAAEEGPPRPAAPLDPAPLLYELADELAPLARAAGLRLVVDVPPHLPPVAIEPQSLRIVARNLLDNALKYTAAGGSVTLSAAAHNGEVLIGVADTGVGIPPEALPRVFERFYRADRARSRREAGAGLGLALVRAIVEAHGGRAEASSEPGAGSVFSVRLPAAGGMRSGRPPICVVGSTKATDVARLGGMLTNGPREPGHSTGARTPEQG